MQRKPISFGAPRWLLVFLLGVMAMGCEGYQRYVNGDRPATKYVQASKGVNANPGEPDYITVQHCLIGFQGSIRGKSISRSREAAGKLAHELFERAKAGENFDLIVSQNTDDSPPGIYKMANEGLKGNASTSKSEDRIYARREMVAAFGNTGFPLEVGQYGIAEHDPVLSPFGWHIVKRIK